ncbi:Moa, A lectin from the mushroom marasmius Oreades in complex with the trisaccharide Galgalglcnac [Armillaria mellea]|nr:Moa, A lectin from the mushroom marasmius Oreades in complex with the trisaccharide Galgalglcnac [Armillaria mellea]
MSISRGIYQIENVGVPLAMDLHNGSSADGTAINGWGFGDGTKLNDNKLWLVEPVTDKADTFTVRNLIAGTYMDLYGGSSADQTPIYGWHRTGLLNQQWVIKHSADNQSYKMMNVESGTFADLYNGGSTDGTRIYGWGGTFNTSGPHQCWKFRRLSLSSAEVRMVIKKSPYLDTDYKGYQADGLYLILPRYHWQEIWNTTGLRNKKWRNKIFDCDDFALAMKAAVAEWGNDKWRADGFAIFCGLMFGISQTNPNDAHAYNFTISEDHNRVVFFEPQTNEFMDNIGYNAYLAFY